jgi:hypothetical protein
MTELLGRVGIFQIAEQTQYVQILWSDEPCYLRKSFGMYYDSYVYCEYPS